MNKKTIILALVIIVILAGVLYWQSYYKKSGQTTNPETQTQSAPGTTPKATLPSKSTGSGTVQTANKTYTIQITDAGYNLKSLDIKSGDTVKFVNMGTFPRWIASDPHPVHNLCPGLDSFHGLIHNESWSHVFNFAAPRGCPFHDHLDPTNASFWGAINIVK